MPSVSPLLPPCGSVISPRLRERREMVKAVALGQEMQTIAARSGRTPRTVCRWLDRFVQGSIPPSLTHPVPVVRWKPTLNIIPLLTQRQTPRRARLACPLMPGPPHV